MSQSKTTHFYKQFRIRRKDGRSTTVSVEPELFIRAIRTLKGVRNVEEAVKEAALEFGSSPDHGTNCSGFVSSKLREKVEAGLSLAN
jgi:hypothetical protein